MKDTPETIAREYIRAVILNKGLGEAVRTCFQYLEDTADERLLDSKVWSTFESVKFLTDHGFFRDRKEVSAGAVGGKID